MAYKVVMISDIDTDLASTATKVNWVQSHTKRLLRKYSAVFKADTLKGKRRVVVEQEIKQLMQYLRQEDKQMEKVIGTF